MIEIITHEHPRLFINQERISELKRLEKTDPFFAALKSGLINKATALLDEDVVPFKITGPRMLKNCQEIHSRVSILALSCLLSGDEKYAIRAKDELISAAAFPHWNKDHFLDTAELITAFAIGYDWLYHVLPKADLTAIKNAMISKGIQPGIEEHKKNIWWAGHKFNWNQVCNGGLIIGALAVADEEPQLCEEVFDATVKFLPIAFNSYGKEGGWEAGPDYWQYTTWYSVLLIDALLKVTGDDFGLSKTEGFNKTGLFPIYTAGPFDKFFNFADAAETYNPIPTLFWLGKYFNNDVFITENHRLLKKSLSDRTYCDAFNLVWYVPAPLNVPQLPLNRNFSDINMGVFRSEWANPRATFIAFKGGFNQADHAHLDIGSFVLDRKGVRWAIDLGRDSYDLPEYFNRSETGGRWNYFRLNNKSHNTLVLNNGIQRVLAKAKIISYAATGNDPEASIDLTEVYTPHATSVIRSIKMLDNATVLITDKIEWAGEAKLVQWQMLTDAEIVLHGNSAELLKDGEKIVATILQPVAAVFEVISAEQVEPEMSNGGFRQLIVKWTEVGDLSEIAISIA
ncbi:heparinase II/III family protein [Haliscomenobacter sp.]|uniref:heparinase II/III domain-containing protein n=1 Tax=Haliscomenobacter sp. TaxID=2717303 RepID=UPI00359449BE